MFSAGSSSEAPAVFYALRSALRQPRTGSLPDSGCGGVLFQLLQLCAVTCGNEPQKRGEKFSVAMDEKFFACHPRKGRFRPVLTHCVRRGETDSRIDSRCSFFRLGLFPGRACGMRGFCRRLRFARRRSAGMQSSEVFWERYLFGRDFSERRMEGRAENHEVSRSTGHENEFAEVFSG